MILTADLGGTKVNLALYEDAEGQRLLRQKTYATTQHPSLEAILRAFVPDEVTRCERVVIAVAGPHNEESIKGNNMPWGVDRSRLCELFGHDAVALTNDLTATAYGCLLEPTSALVTVQDRPAHEGNRAIIAPGTGLGMAYMARQADGSHVVQPSEGGQVDFSPRNAREDALLTWARPQLGRVMKEHFLSGKGLFRLYQFLLAQKGKPIPKAFEEALATDAAPAVIGTWGTGGRCPLCRQAIEWFLDILAAEAGCLAATVYATGGVYIAGGITPKLLPCLDAERFSQIFQDLPTLRKTLEPIPVWIATDENLPLRGAAWLGHKMDPTLIDNKTHLNGTQNKP